MKKIITLLVNCLFCFVVYAQNNYINYKALVKDNLGNVVANQTIDVRFTVFADAAQVYQETHNPTTDANGIVILDIGSGTTSDVFNDIDWSTTTSLQTEIDTGSGYVDLGTTEFKSVPYALNSGNTVFNNETGTISNSSGNTLTDDFVFGSTQLAHIAAENIEDSRFFFDNSLGAFRAGVTEHRPTATPLQDGSAWNFSNIGVGSFASGYNTIASGSYSTALGFVSQASGEFSTAIGDEVSATGENAVALGSETSASGDFSTTLGRSTLAFGSYTTAIGRNTIARSFGSLAIGRHNEGIGDPNAWIPVDPILEIGNGTDDANRSNALTVLKNGIILAPTFELLDYDFSGPKSLVTKEYADAQAGAMSTTANITSNAPGNIATDDFVFGSTELDNDPESSTDNKRLFFDKSKGAFRAGNATSITWDIGNVGEASFASGQNTTASGNFSTATGENSTASGTSSTAMGKFTMASGFISTTTGEYTIASGNVSTAMGSFTRAEGFASTAIGRHNIGGGSPSSALPLNPLFEIGNGSNTSNRSNALTVLQNGTVTAPSFDLIEITDPKALVTKEYVDGGAGSSGLEKITVGANTGWRLKGSDPGNYGDIGFNAVDLSIQQFSSSGGATNNFAFATGEGTIASGIGATAMGIGTVASGDGATAIGLGSTASSFGSYAIGQYNIGGGNPNNWVETDPLFEIGNGSGGPSPVPNNALTVLKNGNTTINGQTTVNEDTASSIAHAITGIKAHTGNYDAYGVLGQNTITDFFGIGVRGNGGWIGVQGNSNGTGSNSYFGVFGESLGNNTGTNYGVYGNASNGATNYAVYAEGDLVHTGALINASDRKLKTNIATIVNSLEDIMRLNPTSYLIRENYQKTMNMSSNSQFGFIAQELQEVFPDLVSRNVNPGSNKQDASIEYLGVNYIGLIPVLTKGIQEQQTTIETLEEKVERQEQVIASLVARLEALENR